MLDITNLLTESQVAARVGLSCSTLRQMRSKGWPPEFIKNGKAVYYDPKVIKEFIESRKDRCQTDGRKTSG